MGNADNMKKSVCIMGIGYIGLPMAAMMANAGHHVRGVDINKNAVSTVNKGAVHFVEPELDTAVQLSSLKWQAQGFSDTIGSRYFYNLCTHTAEKTRHNGCS